MMVLGHESWDGAVRGPPCDPCGRAARSCDVPGAVVSSGTGRAAVQGSKVSDVNRENRSSNTIIGCGVFESLSFE